MTRLERFSVVISPASPYESREGAQLVYLAMRDVLNFLLGFGSTDKTLFALEKFFKRRNNEFSYEFCDFARIDGKPVGLLLSHPAEKTENFALSMIIQASRIYSFFDFSRFLWRALPVSNLKLAEKNQYYISYLAVLPDFQNQGIGTYLMEYAERKATALGFSECAICVLFENEGARRLYERLGYEIVGIIESRYLKTHLEIKGIYRMVKQLTRITVPVIQGVSLKEPEFLPA